MYTLEHVHIVMDMEILKLHVETGIQESVKHVMATVIQNVKEDLLLTVQLVMVQVSVQEHQEKIIHILGHVQNVEIKKHLEHNGYVICAYV